MPRTSAISDLSIRAISAQPSARQVSSPSRTHRLSSASSAHRLCILNSAAAANVIINSRSQRPPQQLQPRQHIAAAASRGGSPSQQRSSSCSPRESSPHALHCSPSLPFHRSRIRGSRRGRYARARCTHCTLHKLISPPARARIVRARTREQPAQTAQSAAALAGTGTTALAVQQAWLASEVLC